MSTQQSPYGGPMPEYRPGSPYPNGQNGPVSPAGFENPGSIPQPVGQPGGPLPPTSPYGGQQPGQPYVPPTAPRQAGPGVVPPPPPRPTTPYDFFMNNQPKPKKTGFSIPWPKSPGAQIAWIAGGGMLFVILIGLATLFTPKADPKIALVTVAQAQTETLRLCTLGTQQAKQVSTKGFATNCVLTHTSERRQLVSYLDKAGAGVKGNVLEQGKNATFDKRLSAAKSASNYDDTFREVIRSQLNSQSRWIKQANSSPITTVTEKKILARYSESTDLLLQQLKQ